MCWFSAEVRQALQDEDWMSLQEYFFTIFNSFSSINSTFKVGLIFSGMISLWLNKLTEIVFRFFRETRLRDMRR